MNYPWLGMMAVYPQIMSVINCFCASSAMQSYFKVIACSFLVSASLTSLNAANYDPLSAYKRESYLGYTILIHPEVLKHPDELVAMRKELGLQLTNIERVIPVRPLATFKKVRIFVEWEKKSNGGAEFHHSANWLKENGYNPEKAGGVEIANTRNFIDWCRTAQPWMILHEMAHAYHLTVLGENDPSVNAAFKTAVERKLYESVAYVQGGQQRAYALTNHKEYFAEISEAYFGRNDFFPFNRTELEKHDPVGYQLMHRVWGKPREEK